MSSQFKSIQNKIIFSECFILCAVVALVIFLIGANYLRESKEKRHNDMKDVSQKYANFVGKFEYLPQNIIDSPYLAFVVDKKTGEYIIERRSQSAREDLLWEQYSKKLIYQMQKQRRGWTEYPFKKPWQLFTENKIIRFLVVDDSDWIIALEAHQMSEWNMLKKIVSIKSLTQIAGLLFVVLCFIGMNISHFVKSLSQTSSDSVGQNYFNSTQRSNNQTKNKSTSKFKSKFKSKSTEKAKSKYNFPKDPSLVGVESQTHGKKRKRVSTEEANDSSAASTGEDNIISDAKTQVSKPVASKKKSVFLDSVSKGQSPQVSGDPVDGEDVYRDRQKSRSQKQSVSEDIFVDKKKQAPQIPVVSSVEAEERFVNKKQSDPHIRKEMPPKELPALATAAAHQQAFPDDSSNDRGITLQRIQSPVLKTLIKKLREE